MEEPPYTSLSNEGRRDEAMFVASSTRTIRNGLKPVLWLWVIGLGAVLVGENDVHSLLSLPLMAGVLVLFAAVVATTYGLWLGAPILIGRVPEAYRPLAKLGFVLLWASTPVWFFYSLHGQPPHLGPLLEYVEFRGYFVAKLFVVGIIAFGFSRHHNSPEYRSIQPYVLLPVVCLFVGGWLAPEEDEGALRMGLTLPLVYYVGTTFAAFVGFFLGQLVRNEP